MGARRFAWAGYAATFVGLLAAPCRPLVAQAPPPGYWRGTGTTDRVLDLNFVKLTIRYESDFTFTTDAAGSVRGTATVRYSMHLDDAVLRGVLSTANAAGNQPLAMVPGMGSLLGLGVNTQNLQGMSASFDEGTPVRRGAIMGMLHGGQLHLQWAAPPAPLPFKTRRVYPLKTSVIRASEAPAYAPWSVDASVRQAAPGHWEAEVSAERTARVKDNIRWTTYWTVGRVPGVTP